MSEPALGYRVVDEAAATGHREVTRCSGPDELGNCPKVRKGDEVPCAGLKLTPLGAKGIETWEIIVPRDSAACPVPSITPRRWSFKTLGVLTALVGFVAGAGTATGWTLALDHQGTAAASAASSGAAAAVSIAIPGDRFSPAYTTVPEGTTVTWKNTDTDPHTVSTAAGLAPAAFDLDLAPGASASHTFTVPGLYVVYCKAHATMDTATGLPKPLSGTDVYPEAMAGVIAVTGPMAATATAATVSVPGDRYSPAFTTVTAGTTVTWNNSDSDPHSVTTAPGLAPLAFDLELAPGASASYTFTTPGLYVVYCKDHVIWDTKTGLPKPVAGTDVFPEAMAGAVLVQPAAT